MTPPFPLSMFCVGYLGGEAPSNAASSRGTTTVVPSARVLCSFPSSFCDTLVEIFGPNGSSELVTSVISGPALPRLPLRRLASAPLAAAARSAAEGRGGPRKGGERGL